MKRSILSLVAVALTATAMAQVSGGDPKYSKLFDMFAMEKFEDCAYKAVNYTYKDKYKRDPEPYLYVSMCYTKIFEMDDPEMDAEYPKALKDALKYAYKFRKKDNYWVKKGEEPLYPQNKGYFDQLKKYAIQEAKAYMVEEAYRKSAGILKYVNKFDPDDHNVKYMTGVNYIMARNTGEGLMALKAAQAGLEENFSDPDFKQDPVSGDLLGEAFVMYSKYLAENDMQDSAKAVITTAKRYIRDDFDVDNQYALLHGLEVKEKPKEEDLDPNKVRVRHRIHISEDEDDDEDEDEEEEDSQEDINEEAESPEEKQEEQKEGEE